MIEVKKLIPKVYNQSRDLSVFTGLLQMVLNELDVKSLKLLKLPDESLLPDDLNTYPHLRGYYRFMIKNKGNIECILKAISLSGGETICRFSEESNLFGDKDDDGEPDWDYQTGNRLESELGDNKKYVVYYIREINNNIELNINLKDPSKVNQGLLKKLLYHIKPVNVVIKLNKGEIKQSV